jgi:hypothetical protein
VTTSDTLAIIPKWMYIISVSKKRNRFIERSA